MPGIIRPADGRLDSPAANDTAVDWNSERVVVRGRKFYRRREGARLGGAAKTNQNRTLRDHLKAGCSASFEVLVSGRSSVSPTQPEVVPRLFTSFL